MWNQKQRRTWEEEAALKAGVAKQGTGKWKNILTDPHCAPFLTQRSNIDLKVAPKKGGPAGEIGGEGSRAEEVGEFGEIWVGQKIGDVGYGENGDGCGRNEE